MFNFLKRHLANKARHKADSLKFGQHIWVYFHNVKKYYEMQVSFVSSSRITARFVNEEDWDESDVVSFYNQIDNDIKLDRLLLTPIKL